MAALSARASWIRSSLGLRCSLCEQHLLLRTLVMPQVAVAEPSAHQRTFLKSANFPEGPDISPHYGVRPDNPCMVWFLGPNSRRAVYLDSLGL